MIRSRRTTIARAVFALHATHRWCVTGTPIQNRLGDLASLLRFLKVFPYDNITTFETEISRPWKSRMDETALGKIQLMMNMLALRRPRAVISLPDRQEIIEPVSFTTEEMQTYNKARLGIIEVIDSALLADDGGGGSVYISAFQKINDLRYICNHGKAPVRKGSPSATASELNDASFQRELDDLLEAGAGICVSCGADIQADIECAVQALDVLRGSAVENSQQFCPNCSMCNVETGGPSPLSLLDLEEEVIALTSNSSRRFSSKVTALVSQLLRVPRGEKWYDHFSRP